MTAPGAKATTVVTTERSEDASLLERILTQPVRSTANLQQVIRGRWNTIKAILPGHLDEKRFAAIMLANVTKNPKILDCTGESLLNAIYTAAQLGLEINSTTGEAYIVPYKTTATLIAGYRGLVKLAIRSREITGLQARLVYQGEEATFRVHYGTNARIDHDPDFTVERHPDRVIAAYAVADVPNGGKPIFDVMTRKQLDAIWRRSRSSDSGPWISDREEMYRKTVARRLCKYLPMSPEMAQAVELGDEMEELSSAPTKTDALNAALRADEGSTDVKPCAKCGRTDGTHDPESPCYSD